MKVLMWWLPARRRAARVEIAAVVEVARKALIEHQKLARTAQITGSADDQWAADEARRRCQHQWFAIGDAMRALPKRERELVEVWDRAAAMAWWHRTSDRQGWACFEAAAAQVIAALPGGVDSDAVAAVIEASARRFDVELQRRSDVNPGPVHSPESSRAHSWASAVQPPKWGDTRRSLASCDRTLFSNRRSIRGCARSVRGCEARRPPEQRCRHPARTRHGG